MSLRSDFAEAQRRRGVLRSSIDKRDGCLRLFEDWLDPRGLFDASAADVETFLDGRRNRSGDGPISDRTRYAWISHLHAFYSWAQRRELTEADPTVSIDRPRMRLHLPRPIGEAELHEALDGARNDPQLAAWLALMAFGGLRCAEVATLDREDVLDHEGVMRVVGKGNRERLVPIHPRVAEALSRYGMPRFGPIFCREDGSRWLPYQVSHRVRRHLERLGIDATAHQLRHRFGTYAYRATRDLRTVAEVMGHSSVITTQGYVAYSRTEAKAAVDGIPDPA